ncbi:hypothetical protein [Nocardia wallacei]|uniref:hypothetical protein n=1 Tax=Nocardia wallacei TaxID=480035 RepID=UPI002458CF94|nr:hypothetical protein [Nocardia wallacei]
MNSSDPLSHKTFVHAEGKLAEFMCCVYLMGLTRERAEELRSIHQHHRLDDCVVHLEAAYLLLNADAED